MEAQAQVAGRHVPFFKYPEVFREHAEEYLCIMQEIGNRGAFIMQRELDSFEKNLARFVGAKHALGVANATDGLFAYDDRNGGRSALRGCQACSGRMRSRSSH
jgi:hypothetical protein